MDQRKRRIEGITVTVGELAAAEKPLALRRLPLPAALEITRTVTPQGQVAFEANSYAVPPGLPAVQVHVVHRTGEDRLDIVTAGRAVARHRVAPRGSGRTVREAGHVVASERAVRDRTGPTTAPNSWTPQHPHPPGRHPPANRQSARRRALHGTLHRPQPATVRTATSPSPSSRRRQPPKSPARPFPQPPSHAAATRMTARHYG